MHFIPVTLTADGSDIRSKDSYTTELSTEGLDHVALSLNENDDATTHRCEHCSEELDNDTIGENIEPVTVGGDNECSENTDDDDDNPGQHKPVPVPLTWAQNAGVILDRDDDAIHVYIAADDPRGGFQMTIRRMEDGSLIMHLPYEGMSGPHMPLKEIHAGTFKLG